MTMTDSSAEAVADRYMAANDEMADRRDDGEHCDHHQHDEECGGEYGDCDDDASDDCVHCRCCCTCAGCEYAEAER